MHVVKESTQPTQQRRSQSGCRCRGRGLGSMMGHELGRFQRRQGLGQSGCWLAGEPSSWRKRPVGADRSFIRANE